MNTYPLNSSPGLGTSLYYNMGVCGRDGRFVRQRQTIPRIVAARSLRSHGRRTVAARSIASRPSLPPYHSRPFLDLPHHQHPSPDPPHHRRPPIQWSSAGPSPGRGLHPCPSASCGRCHFGQQQAGARKRRAPAFFSTASAQMRLRRRGTPRRAVGAGVPARVRSCCTNWPPTQEISARR